MRIGQPDQRVTKLYLHTAERQAGSAIAEALRLCAWRALRITLILWFESRTRYGSKPCVRNILLALGLCLCSAFGVAATKPNLILITLDSTRADRMGFLGAKAGITPNLDHLAAESLVFEHAYAQAPGTVVSHATILSGAYPQTTGMSEIGGTLPTSLPYLPDLLKAQGYRTAAFVGSIQLDPRNGLAQGFDRGFQTYDAGFRPAFAGDARPTLTALRQPGRRHASLG